MNEATALLRSKDNILKKLEESGIKVPVNLDQDKISKIIGLLEDLSYVCDELDDYDRRKEASLYFRPGVD